MKKTLLLTSLLLLLIFILNKSFAQNIYTLQYLDYMGNPVTTLNLTRGDTTSVAKARLTVTNSSGILEGQYLLKSYATQPVGLYIQNAVKIPSSSASSFSLNSSLDELSISLANESITSLEIDFHIWAGQCFLFNATDPNTLSLATPFSLINNSTQASVFLSGNNSITINKGAFLTYLVSESVLTATPDAFKNIAFSYVVENSSSLVFKGKFSFQESLIGKAYDVRAVKFYKWTANTWVLLSTFNNPIVNSSPDVNNNDFVMLQSLQIADSLVSGEKIKIEEIVRENGCLSANAAENNSSPMIRWGNSAYDLCSDPGQVISSFIDPNVSFAPALQYDNSGSVGNYACYGAGSKVRSLKITNAGNDAAGNVMLHLFNQSISYSTISPISIPYTPNTGNDNADIYLMINGVKYILNLDKYTVTYTTVYDSTTAPLYITKTFFDQYAQASGYALYYYSKHTAFNFPVNGILSLDEIDTDLFGINRSSYSFSTTCLGGFSTKIITDLYIDEIKLAGSTGAFQSLVINSGDVVEFFWKEQNCCFKNDVSCNDVFGSNISIAYDELCGRQEVDRLIQDRSLIQLYFDPAPAASTTDGEVDKCPSTSDGLVERISSKILAYPEHYFITPDKYNNNDGRIVFRIYLQNGFDLDKSLTQPTAWGWTNQPGFNNVTDQTLYVQNGSTQCDQSLCSTTGPCDLNNTITNPADKFYVKLRPESIGNGQLISPSSIVLLQSDSKVQLKNMALSAMTQPLNPDLIFDDSAKYANFLYEISFNISDLVQFSDANGGANSSSNDKLNRLLTEASLDFDIRAYCQQNDHPIYKVVMYNDKCAGAPSGDQSSNCAPGFTTMQPISSFEGTMIINCPGCKIPGGNIDIAFLERSSGSKGLADLDENRVPDGTTALPSGHPTLHVVAMGDTLEANFANAMSDGVLLSTGAGILKSQLDSAGIFLDNFFVRADLAGGADSSSLKIASVEITYAGITKQYSAPLGLKNVLFYETPIQFLLRINVRDFVSSSTSFGVGESISYKIKYVVGNISSTPQLCDISYVPYYTPCDSCNSIAGSTDVNPATNPAFIPFTLSSILPLGDLTLWKCTGFSNTFRFYPFIQSSDYVVNDNNCSKTTNINLHGNFYGNQDVFTQEFRTFLRSDLKTQISIPYGYLPYRMTIANSFTVAAKGYNEVYDINNLSLINSLISSNPGNALYPNVCNVSLNYKRADSLVSLAGLIQIQQQGPDNFYKIIPDIIPDGSGGHSLILGDEYYNVTVSLYYQRDTAIACSSIPDYDLADTLYSNKSNIPTDGSSSDVAYNPNATLQSFPSDRLTWTWPTVYVLRSPNANIMGVNVGNTSFTITNNQLLQIPVPVKITDDFVQATGVVNAADFPYFRVYGAALAKGLEFVGIYQGNNSIPNPALTDYYTEYFQQAQPANLSSDGIIVGVDRYLPNARPANTIPTLKDLNGYNQKDDYYYTLVFRYTCPSTCNLNIGCGTNTLPTGCLQGTDTLKVEYGWNCGSYPNFNQLKNNSTCGRYAPINYNLNVAPVGLNVTNALNGVTLATGQAITLDPCTPSTYTLNLNSCKEGAFDAFAVEFLSLPTDIIITPPATAGPFSVAADSLNNRLFHLSCSGCSFSNQSMNVDFTLSTSCKTENGTLTTKVSTRSYCDANPTLNTTFSNAVNVLPTLSNIALDNITVTPTTGITVSANTLTIKYTLASSAVYDDALIVDISGIKDTIKIPAGTTSGLKTSTITLPAACATYTVTVTPQLGYVPPCGYSGGMPIPVCVDLYYGSPVTKSITVTVPVSVNAGSDKTICAGGSVQIGAAPIAGATYSWSPSTMLSDATIANPYASPTATTTYTVTATITGCIVQDAVVVTVNPIPTANAGTDVSICSGSSAVIGTTGVGGVSYHWSPSTGLSNSSIAKPTANPGVTTTYLLTATAGSCTATDTVVVSINSHSTASFSTSSSLCTGNAIQFINTSTNVIPTATFSWSYGTGATPATSSDSLAAPVVYSSTGTKNIKLVINNGGCVDSFKLSVSIGSCGNNCNKTYTTSVGTIGIPTTISPPIAGETSTFSGTYRMRGRIILKNGTFVLNPGTIFYMDEETEIGPTDIELDNATLIVNGATITSFCDIIWYGIVVGANSSIVMEGHKNTISQQIDSSEISNARLAVDYKFASGTKIQIQQTRFHNNIDNIHVGSTSGFTGTNYIKNNRFYSEPNKMKFPYNPLSTYMTYYSNSGIWGNSNLANLTISGNTFTNMMCGVEGEIGLNSATISSNTFTNCYGGAVYNFDVQGEIANNTITIPSAKLNTVHINPNATVYGIYATEKFNIHDNTIQSDNPNPFDPANTKDHVGIFTEIVNGNSTIANNNIKRLKRGIDYNINSNLSQTVSGNTFTDNMYAMNVPSSPYSTSSSSSVNCNAFKSTSTIGSAAPRGINIVLNAPQLNGFGTSCSAPAGNKYTWFNSGVSTGLFNNNQTPITYYAASNENFNGINVTTNLCGSYTCGGTTGAGHRLADSAPIEQVEDSLKSELGTTNDLQYYQQKIIDYYIQTNNITELETYVVTLADSNLNAYNTLALFLINYYQGKNDSAKVEAYKNAVLEKNPDNEEIYFRIKYLDIANSVYSIDSMNISITIDSLASDSNYVPAFSIRSLSTQDSTDLSEIANSATSKWERACIRLRHYYPHAKCSDIAPYDTLALYDEERKGSFKIASPIESAYLDYPIPNPANNETTISYTLIKDLKEAKIIIYDMIKGIVIRTYSLPLEKINGSIHVNLSGFSSGIYAYSLIVNGNNIDTKKMVVVK